MENQLAASGTSRARRVAVGGTVGAVLGFVVWSLVGPSVISWWYEPPSKDAFSCAGSVKTALSQFVTMQLISAAAGAFTVGIVLFALRRGRKSNPTAPAGS